MINNEILKPKTAAQYLSVSTSTLARWRHIGSGPTYIKFGNGGVAYEKIELDKFIAHHRIYTFG